MGRGDDKEMKMQLFRERLTEFDRLKRWPFDEKLASSKELIEHYINEFNGRAAVACSFGKDSTVVLHLALQVDPNILVAFQNTGVEYPETLAFKDRLKNEWNLNLFEQKPEKTFWQCVKEYGLPHLRWWSGNRPKGVKSGTPRCCYWLKEKPGYNFYEERGIKAVFMGLTWDESYQRRFWIIRMGMSYQMKTRDLRKIYPIAYWTTEDVWRYIRENNLPYNAIYDKGHDRCGCKPCTGFIGWQKQMARENPKLYASFQERFGQRVVEYYLETHVKPCSERG